MRQSSPRQTDNCLKNRLSQRLRRGLTFSVACYCHHRSKRQNRYGFESALRFSHFYSAAHRDHRDTTNACSITLWLFHCSYRVKYNEFRHTAAARVTAALKHVVEIKALFGNALTHKPGLSWRNCKTRKKAATHLSGKIQKHCYRSSTVCHMYLNNLRACETQDPK